jgi:putative intracellular protease/amidase
MNMASQLAGKHVVIIVANEVVRDPSIITSRAPNDLPEFCQAIVQALTE